MCGHSILATRTGLEPATSAVTGRRANQLRYRALKIENISGSYVTLKPFYNFVPNKFGLAICQNSLALRAPNGIRTRVTAVKGRCPRPLDDGDV